MAKCNLGKVNLKAMLSSWMQKACPAAPAIVRTIHDAVVAVRGRPKLRGRPSSSQGHLVTPTRSLVLTRVTFAAGSRAPKAWGGPSSSRGTWCPLHAVWCLHESVSLAVTLASSQFSPIPPARGLVPSLCGW